MARATWLLSATTLAGAIAAIWLYADNRALRDQLAHRDPEGGAHAEAAAARSTDPWLEPARRSGARLGSLTLPVLPEAKEESRLDRRARRTAEIAAMFGRLDGESADDYRNRIVPLIKAGLALPRSRAEDMRKAAEDKAHVTPEQSRKLDRAFDKVYGDVVDYTNKAVADGQLSPYERNVAGWLQFAGGLGGILDETNGQIAQILSPDQIQTMSDSGFEWGEYLGLEAPWEKLDAPPPRRADPSR